MAADRVWRLYPHAVDAEDDAFTDVWVDTRVASDLVVAERDRQTVQGYLRGSPITYAVVQAIQSRVVRIRYRTDLTVRGVIVDDEDRNWFIDGWSESGTRRQFLDVSCTAYDLTSPIETGTGTPDGVAPTGVPGWHLQDADGEPLLQFDGAAVVTRYDRRGFPSRVQINVGMGWQIASGESFAVDDEFEGELSDGTDVLVTFVEPDDPADLNDLTGTRWPSAGLHVSTDPGGVARNAQAGSTGLRIGRSA